MGSNLPRESLTAAYMGKKGGNGRTNGSTGLHEKGFPMDDIKGKINELLNAHPDLVEKVKSAPGEVADAIRKATGLNLDASDLDKVKGAIHDFVGDDGLDLGDVQRAFEALVEKGKEAAANIDTEAIKDGAADLANKGAAIAASIAAKSSEVAADFAAKSESVAADLAAKAEAGKAAAEETVAEVVEDAEAAIEDVKEAAAEVVEDAEVAVENVKEAATEVVEDVKEVVEEATGEDTPAE